MPGPSADLLALLRPRQVVVRVGGHPFTLTATTAAQWLGAIATDMDNLCGIMPGLVHDDDLDVMCDLIDTHPDIETRWTNAARVALGRAGGRDWWWTRNLAREALGTWIYTNGLLLHRQVNSRQMPLPDWLDACYTLYWQGGDDESRLKLDMKLNMRPRGVATHQSASQTRSMMAQFAAD